MTKDKGKRGKGPKGNSGTLEALAKWLESVDFDSMESIVQALGESKDSAAVEPLVNLAKKVNTLRHATIVALKKLAKDDEQAAIELSIATQKEQPDSVGGEWGVRVFTPSDRRCTPRVLLEIPVLVKWADDSGTQWEGFATTRIVNATGGLLTLRELVPDGTLLELTNVTTKAVAKAKVFGQEKRNQKADLMLPSNLKPRPRISGWDVPLPDFSRLREEGLLPIVEYFSGCNEPTTSYAHR